MNENNVSQLLEKAQALFLEKRLDEAVVEVKKYLDSEDLSLAQNAKRLFGQICFSSRDFQEAQKYFSEVIKSSPSCFDYFNLCISSIMSGDLEMAEKSFNIAIDLSSKEKPETKINLTYFYTKTLIDSKEYNRAFDKIKIIMGYFFDKNSITDYTHLILKSSGIVPSLGDLLSLILQISSNIEKSEVIAYLSDIYEKVDSDGKIEIDKVKNLLI